MWLVSGNQIDSQNDWSATWAGPHAWVMVAPTPEGGLTVQAITQAQDRSSLREYVEEVFWNLGKCPNLNLIEPSSFTSVAPQLGEAWSAESFTIGDELLALDPLAGDGIGSTIRTSVWLAGTLRSRSLDAVTAQAIFNGRINTAFQNHISTTARYYQYLDGWEEHATNLARVCTGVINMKNSNHSR